MTEMEVLEYYIKEVKGCSYDSFARTFGDDWKSVINRLFNLRRSAEKGLGSFSSLVLKRFCDQIGLTWEEIKEEVLVHMESSGKEMLERATLLREKQRIDKQLETI